MRYIYSEAQNNYSNYLFSYQAFALRDEKDSVEDIYSKGFLPVRSIRNLFYLCRNCRINLSKFELSSENKRVIKQLEGYACNVVNKKDYVFKSGDFTERKYLNKISVRRIFSGASNYNKVFDFDKTGIVVSMVTDSLVHYAHSFYKREGVGIPMMAYVVDYAKNEGKKYIYLGTCYGKNSLYKAQYKGFEFFDGISWSDDLDKLKFLVQDDGNSLQTHLLQNEQYLEKYYNVKKIGRLVKKLQNE